VISRRRGLRCLPVTDCSCSKFFRFSVQRGYWIGCRKRAAQVAIRVWIIRVSWTRGQVRIVVSIDQIRRLIASIWAACMLAVVLLSAYAAFSVASADPPPPVHGAEYVYWVRVSVWAFTLLLVALLPIGRYLWFRRCAAAGQFMLVRGLMVAAVATYTLCAIPPVLGFAFFVDNALPFGQGLSITGLSLLQMLLYMPQYSFWEERLFAVDR